MRTPRCLTTGGPLVLPDMDSILVILHQERSRTRRVGRVLRQMGYTLDIRRPCRGDALPLTMDEHAAAVIFGGPMGVYECEKHPFLRDELDWISLALESGKPFLGICLGCQMLAHVLGGRVWRHPDGLHEVGYYPVLPTAEGADIFESPFHAFQWHRDAFEVPRSCTLLARGGEAFENQVFQYGANAFGVQFHPELTPSTMVKWTTFAHDKKVPGVQPIDDLLAQKGRNEPMIRRWLGRFVDRWLGEAPLGPPARRG